MDKSFGKFLKEYWFLFAAILVLPFFIVTLYYMIFGGGIPDKAISATFFSCIISYIGTIAWGVFIFFDSWQRNVELEYKNRPLVVVRAELSDLEPYNYRLYDREEVNAVLRQQVGIYGLNSSYNRSHNIKYIRVTLTNYGQTVVSDLSLVTVDIQMNRQVKVQGSYGFLSSPDLDKVLGFKESWDIFVAIDETLFNEFPEGYKEITMYLQFKHDILSTFMARLVVKTAGIGTYGQQSYIYDPYKMPKGQILK